MAFRIKKNELVADATARLLEDALDSARAELVSREGSRKEHFHEARKHVKKARAVLRVLRETMGEKRFRRENREYRDVGRALSGVRDAQVLADSFESLMKRFDAPARRDAFRSVESGIAAHAERMTEKLLGDREALDEAERRLVAARRRVSRFARGKGWRAIEGGIRRVYRSARRSYRNAYEAPSDSAFHEWRKSVKYLRYQVQLLGGSWEGPLEALRGELHALSDCLGLDHDLAMLRDTVEAEPDAFGDGATVAALFALIERHQAELRREARARGRRLFAERPKAFVRRLGSYWRAWREAMPPEVAARPRLTLAA